MNLLLKDKQFHIVKNITIYLSTPIIQVGAQNGKNNLNREQNGLLRGTSELFSLGCLVG